ncbi:MAG: hypothetical protein JSV88_16145 [Candidatus Aminicenantes bacterium]|nr:MAG: hypothetical protein JSV88_16145 [Candidatus Aminicenantes bacterium]
MKTVVIFIFVFFLVFLVWGTHINSQEELPLLKDVSIYQQYQKAMKSMKFLGETILDYVDHFNRAPKAKTLKELLAMDCGIGLTFAEFFFDEIPEEKIPLKDVWENDFLYKYQRERFWIASPGSDGEFEGFEQTGVYPNTETYLPGKDIIFSNGRFVSFPIEKDEFNLLFRLFLEAVSSFR